MTSLMISNDVVLGGKKRKKCLSQSEIRVAMLDFESFEKQKHLLTTSIETFLASLTSHAVVLEKSKNV